jgi:CubicO group peptidase (beta-lactamase class C family)
LSPPLGSEDKDTLYQACSISKAITGLAVAKLIDQGHLKYSTLITDHLPQEIVNSSLTQADYRSTDSQATM